MTALHIPSRRTTFGFAVLAVLAPCFASAQANFDTAALKGNFVMTFHGSFSSAPPPPLPSDVLTFEAAEVGRLTFDGSGQAIGVYTLTFHNAAIPFQVRSRFSMLATYTVSPDGHVIIEAEEYRLDAAGTPTPMPVNTVKYECYIVAHQQLAECLQVNLVSLQQGPEPRLLPHSMSGSLQRQR